MIPKAFSLKPQQGFTLIELMIVVAIVGILAAVAIPQFVNYAIRARVTEGLNLASAAKTAVSETAITNSALPATQAATGYVSPAATDNVASIAIAGDGTAEITITYQAVAGGGTIILKPTVTANSDITWDCSGGTLIGIYRPTVCR
jgi:type IV pilus assembly protein PilA